MLKDLYKEAEDKYHSFFLSARDKGVKVPLSKEELKQVFMLSNFIYQNSVKSPEIILELVETGDLFREYLPTEYRHRLDQEIDLKDEDAILVRKLRHIRKREMVRIAWRDLLGYSDTLNTMKELSAFADACIDKSVEIFHAKYSKKYGTPVGNKSGSPQQLAVIGLGKLGGEELNFSSDIDLMFAYPESGNTYSKLSNEEFFSLVATGIIRLLSKHTEDGFVFRVDTRLRPFGKSGPIVMNFDAMEEYYYSYGREWERYALIKARIVGGDRKKGEELLSELRPFIYRRYLDYTVFDSLREMKQKILEEAHTLTILDDIKIGPGGIREIEFFTQVFQLLRGGVDPDLQVQSTLKALDVLEKKGYISKDISTGLKEAYLFLRKLENRLQQYNNLQTHAIPDSYIQRLRLAISMGYTDWNQLYDQLREYTSFVHKQFEQLLVIKDKIKDSDPLNLLWNIKEKDKRIGILKEIGFYEPQKIAAIISELEELKAITPKGRSALKKLMVLILKRLLSEKKQEEILIRLSSLIKEIQSKTSYFYLMLENPQVIDHLIRLAKESSWIISFVSKFPVLLDELIDPRNLYTLPTKEELKRDMMHRLENISSDDTESFMIQLALFRHTNTLRIAAADISGVISVMEVSTYLTDIAEVILDAAMRFAWKYCLEKFGFDEDMLPAGKGFSIIGYGKLGGRELSYSSDLDLVFLHSGKDPELSSFYVRVAQRIIFLLTTYTSMGRAYEIDTRLRPDGSSGILAVNIDSFRQYQHHRAWTWEHQALLRARAVCGDGEIMKKFERIRYEVLSKKRDKKRLFNEIWDMREKLISQLSKKVPGLFHIKNDPGGIIDLEFLIQYLTLLNAHSYPELLKHTAHIYFLEGLERFNLIDKEDASFLKDAYINMRYTLHRLSLQELKPYVEEDKFSEVRKRIIKMWDKIRP